jgi:acyl carrier protein
LKELQEVNETEVQATIVEVLSRIIREKGTDVPSMDDSTVLLGGHLHIDSLELALLVTELEERTGKDPFASGFREFRTIGELATLYG